MAFATNLAAINAAKKITKEAGFNANEYKRFFKSEKHDGEWHALQIEPFPAPRDPAQSLLDQREGIYPFPTAQEAAERAATEAQEHARLQAEADALANAQQAATTLPNGKIWIHISSVPKPTKLVHVIADEMLAAARAAGKPEPTRKEVQDECIRRGIASGTARTQYQAWRTAHEATKANAAAAAAASARFNGKK